MQPPPEQSSLVFVPDGDTGVEVELCVHFGLFAGRDVTPWEIERLGTSLLDEVDAVTVISEQRHEIGRTGGGAIHQVRVEIAKEHIPEAEAQRLELERRLVERLELWARSCFADRHSELEEA